MLRKHELRMNPTDLPMLLEQSYDHVVWEEKAELCHSCGSCNLVCPTCYCFDVSDTISLDLAESVRRYLFDVPPEQPIKLLSIDRMDVRWLSISRETLIP